MLLGFKRRFEQYVVDGSKWHTIRGKRKNRPKVGMRADCYVDSRQKTMRLLRRSPITRVQDIRIEGDGTYTGTAIYIDGSPLDEDERNAFAWRDGFRPKGSTAERPGKAFDLMLYFWQLERKTLAKGKPAFPFVGDLIWWDPEVKLER